MPCTPKFLVYLVVFCFAKRCPKQNTVARFKSKNLSPQNFVLATPLVAVDLFHNSLQIRLIQDAPTQACSVQTSTNAYFRNCQCVFTIFEKTVYIK